jgi:hypothetical protein
VFGDVTATIEVVAPVTATVTDVQVSLASKPPPIDPLVPLSAEEAPVAPVPTPIHELAAARSKLRVIRLILARDAALSHSS